MSLKSQQTADVVTLQVVEYSTSIAPTTNNKFHWTVPGKFNGFNLIDIAMSLGNTKSTSGKPTVQISRGRAPTPGGARVLVDTLITPLTIDVNEWHSKDASVSAVINTSNDDLLEGDVLYIDLDNAGTGAEGLEVALTLG